MCIRDRGYPDGTWYVKQNLLLTIPDVKADEPDIELPEAEVKVEQGGTGAVLNKMCIRDRSGEDAVTCAGSGIFQTAV